MRQRFDSADTLGGAVNEEMVWKQLATSLLLRCVLVEENMSASAKAFRSGDELVTGSLAGTRASIFSVAGLLKFSPLRRSMRSAEEETEPLDGEGPGSDS